MMKRLLLALALVLAFTQGAWAIPHLQIFIEGATYDTDLESWVTSATDFKLWVIGDVSKDGAIWDVKLAASMYGSGGSISISPTTTGSLADPSTPSAPTDLGTDMSVFESGGIYETPAFTPVKNHAEFADADYHQFWGIGDFTETDSPIGDYQLGGPVDYPDLGQINVYDVSVSGWSAVHWDAFDHTVHAVGNGRELAKWWFVPPSHDATAVPEPGTLALLGLGLVGLGVRLRRKR